MYSYSKYENTRRVTYENGATFIPVCVKCHRYVRAFAFIMMNGRTQLSERSNATCKKCGPTNMLFEGFV